MPDAIAYLYDGSLEGLLSAVFCAYERHEDPEDVVAERDYQPRLGQEARTVPTDFERAQRVRRGVEKAVGVDAFRAVQRAAMCEDPCVGTVVYRFVRYAMARPAALKSQPVLAELGNPVVSDLASFRTRALNEAEKMRQFVRFRHLENGVWYAKYAPNAAVVPLVMGYFADRLNDQPFIIYDERHRMAGLYDGMCWSLVAGEALNVPADTQDEAQMQEAWKRFYDALAIDARYNPELRRNFMPNRLRSNLTELQPRCAVGGSSDARSW